MAETKRRARVGRVSEQGAVVWTKDALEKIGSTFVARTADYLEDGWGNVATGLGIASRDKRLGATLTAAPRIGHQKELLEELYHGDDLAGRIIDLPAQEMYREWIDLTAGNEDGENEPEVAAEILQEADALGAQRAFTDAEVWAALYGGSLILLGVDDGQEPDQELNFDNIRSLEWLTVLDRFDVEVDTYYEDPMEEKFGLPRTYRLTSNAEANRRQGSSEVRGEFNEIIHESRTIRFDGQRTSRRKRRENQGWGDSVFERYYEVVRDFQGASGGIMHLLQDFSQAVYKIKGLAKALAGDKDNLVIKRLKLLDIGRSIVRAVPLDADAEEFERTGATVTGLSDLYDRMMMRLSAATGIPVTLLFGRSPAGMNSTGESDIRLFYDHIAAKQETQSRPRIEYLLEVMLNAKEGPTGGKEPSSWNFEFNPLYQESAKEQAETRLAVAKADEVYMKNKVLTADEVADSRFGGDTYSPETMLDKEMRAQEGALEEVFGRLAPEPPPQLLPPGQQLPSEQQEEQQLPPNQDGRYDSPNYRLQEDEDRVRQICSTCVHGAASPVCQRFDFVWDPGHTCDDWQKVTKLIKIQDRVDRKKKGGRRRRRKRRGRNC